jgi:hypothetical protein
LAIRSDNPIRRDEDDALGRAGAARSFARQVLGLDASEGVVVGVLGPWGSGKTSFVNLARNEFEAEGVSVLEFNPWMFSGAEQLVQSFFAELAAQLKIRPGLAEIGREVGEYGDSFAGLGWIPFVGTWIERARVAAKLIGKASEQRKDSVLVRRSKLQKALANLEKPIIVIIDDLDRLTTPEIRDIFKLVRLTASFPNMIYLLAFDRKRVEDALDESRAPGRAYLEKILQIAIDLPAIPDQVLGRQILSTIGDALSGIENTGPFNEEAWPDLFAEIVRPLIHNMRDVRRYAAAIRGTVIALEGQIALVDVLCLEAFRVFLPDGFAHLHGAVDGLTSTADFGASGSCPRILPELTTLSSKLQLILQVGHREDIGLKLVSEDASNHFERSWREEVRSSPIERLLREPDPMGVVYWAKLKSDPGEPVFNIEDSPALTLALLRAAETEVKSQSVGSRAVKRSPRLKWDELIELFGDEASLRKRIEDLKATNPQGVDALLVVVDKYLGGWRPSRHDAI